MAREMKDTGLQWLGQIPKEWNLVRIGTQYTERRTKVSDTEYPPLSVTMKGILPQLSTAAKTDAHDDRKLVCVGDFAINSRSDRRGSCGISHYDGSVSLINTILTPREKMNPRYYDWLFHSTMFSDEYYSWGHGIVDDLWTTGWQDMKKIMIPEPPLDEQCFIAAFLDRKCAEIDSAIADTQRTIEEYKKLKQTIITEAVTKGIRGERPMKDSGIEWIGEIPEEWDIKKGKWILSLLDQPVFQDDGVITCFRDGEVTLRSKRREDGFTISLQEAGYQGINVGDLVVHGMDGFAGAIGISDSRGKGTPVLNVLDSTQNKRYIMYYLRSMAYNGVFLALATGIRVRSCDTNWNKLKELPYPKPSIDEQEEIASFIDNKIHLLDELIEKKETLRIELENYKKSVIYEYVTGKKEVPTCQ